jgi:hypothetical protein
MIVIYGCANNGGSGADVGAHTDSSDGPVAGLELLLPVLTNSIPVFSRLPSIWFANAQTSMRAPTTLQSLLLLGKNHANRRDVHECEAAKERRALS